MILFEYGNWTIKNTSYPKEFNIYHNCFKDSDLYVYKKIKEWGTLYKKQYPYHRSTNCGRCAKSIPNEVIFLLEMIK